MSRVPASPIPRRSLLAGAAAVPLAAGIAATAGASDFAELSPTFAAALADYRAAVARCRVGVLTDEQLDAEIDTMSNAAVRLATMPTHNSVEARELARLAFERLRPDVPADRMDIDNPASMAHQNGHAIDLGLLAAAVRGLGADPWQNVAEDRESDTMDLAEVTPAPSWTDGLLAPDGLLLGQMTTGAVASVAAVMCDPDYLLPCGTPASQATDDQKVAAREVYRRMIA